MSTSEHKAFIRHDSATFGDGYPVDAAMYKDALRNNLMHLADEFGQTLVNYVARSGVELSTEAPGATGTWYHIVTHGPFALKTKSDGTPYPIVVRIAGFASAANSVTFRVGVFPRRQAPSGVVASTLPTNIVEVSTSATTAAWLSPSPYVATVDQYLASDMIEQVATSDAVSFGTPRPVSVCMAEISVWAKTTNVAATPKLAGLYAREYIGT